MPEMRASLEQALKIAHASARAARHACTEWHYSRSVPFGDHVRLGAWEHGRYVGCVIFSRGANRNIAAPFSLGREQVCELTRVALRAHAAPVSRILAICLRLLRSQCPGIALVISYADSAHSHTGGIYQAGGWRYLGPSIASAMVVNGERMHKKTAVETYGTGANRVAWLREHVDPDARRVAALPKYKYAIALSQSGRDALTGFPQLPYPKHAPALAERLPAPPGADVRTDPGAPWLSAE